MRRLFAAATLCAVFLLPTCVAAAAPGLLHPAESAPLVAGAVPPGARADGAPYSFAPLARALTGTGTISLNVYTFEGDPETGADVGWWVVEDTDSGSGEGVTDWTGHVDLTGVPAATSDNGEIAVFTDDAQNTAYDLWGLSWGDAGWTGGLQPGRLPITVVRSTNANWNYWTSATAYLWSEKGAETHLARTDIPRTANTTDAYAHTITTGPEQLSGGALYFWSNEGMELPVSGTAVSPGTTASPSLTIREAEAQRIYDPTWSSGKPGTVVKLRLQGFPTGWVNHLTGQDSSTGRVKDYGGWTSTGTGVKIKNLTIPRTATPGRTYGLQADHENGAASLSLYAPFQVCTLIPSENPVRRYHKLVFSGKVPFKPGSTKRVTLYRRYTRPTGQPKYAGGAKKVAGWTKLGTASANGISGKYTFARIWPSRTAWYCVWYGKDAQHWAAWTSVVKVVKK